MLLVIIVEVEFQAVIEDMNINNDLKLKKVLLFLNVNCII